MDTVRTDERNGDTSEIPGGEFEIIDWDSCTELQSSTKTQVRVISENGEKHGGEIINLGPKWRSPKSPSIIYCDEKNNIIKDARINILYASDFLDRTPVNHTRPWSRMETTVLATTSQKVVLKFTKLSNKKLLREAEGLFAVPKHPNVLPLLGEFQQNDELCLVSPRHDWDLLGWVQNHSCPHGELVNLALEMARGLALLHRENVIHGDVTLRHFVLTQVGVQICDFGLSVFSCRDDLRIPWQRQGPEVLRNLKYEPHCDVYSFGVSIWELWSGGKTAFGDLCDISSKQFVERLNNFDNGGELLSMCDTPDDIQYLIRQCTKILPHQRPTMKDVVTYLGNRKAIHDAILQIEKINNKDKPHIKHKDKNSKNVIYNINIITDNIIKDATLKTAPEAANETEDRSDIDGDELLIKFFQKVLKPSSKNAQMCVQNYVDMCIELGIERKSDLVTYLNVIRSVEEMSDDCMVFKKVHLTSILETLFDVSRARFMNKILNPTHDKLGRKKSDEWDVISKPSKDSKKIECPVEHTHCSPGRRYFYISYPGKTCHKQGPTNTCFLRGLLAENKLNMFSLIYDNQNPCFKWRKLFQIPKLVQDLDPTNSPTPSQPSNSGNTPSLSSNSSNPKKNQVILKAIPTTSGIGKKIHNKFVESWTKKSVAEPTSITILEIQNRFLSDRFLAHKKNVELECKSGQDVVREHVFHGSSTLCNFSKASAPGSFQICDNSKCVTCNITRVGFEVNRCATNSLWGRFGRGIYFAENASKAHDYTTNVKAREQRIIFVADLVVGNVKTYTTNQTRLEAPPDGFHSVFGKPSPQDALNSSENVVYCDDAALPTHCIHYRVVAKE